MAGIAGVMFIPYYDHLMKLLETNAELKKTARGIFKQTACAAGGTIVGGAVGGPAGALVGGVVGSAVGYWISDDYSNLIKVLRDLDDQEKEELVKKVQELVGGAGIEALTGFIGTQVHRELLLQLVRQFVNDRKQG